MKIADTFADRIVEKLLSERLETMKQTVTVIYEDTMGVAINILQVEGTTTLPEGVTPMNYAKDVFMEKFAGWRQVYDDGHVMVFEKES